VRLVLAIALGALGLAACSKHTTPAPDAGAPECASRADCTAEGGDHLGEICTPQGACAPCGSDGQCDLRERCDPVKLRCAFKPGWGDDCSVNADCQAGQLCVQGLCVASQDAILCPGGTCLADGTRCNKVNGVCEQDIGCLSDADCLDAELCNVPTNACVLRCSAQTQGQICGAGQKCVSSRCTDCADDSDCTGGLVCDLGRLTCVVNGALNCLSDRDCAAGLVCDPVAGFCTPKKPPCSSNEDCPGAQSCDVPSGDCVAKGCQPDRFEPNSTLAQAAPLTEGTYDSLTLCDQAQDWFSIKLTRGDTLNVFVDADPLFTDEMDTRLLDGTGRALAQGALALNTTVSSDAAYYLRLQSTAAEVDYGLRLTVSKGTPCDADRFEPNDTASGATPLHDQGDYDKLTLCGLDQDWFLLDVPAGKKLLVQLNYVPTEGLAELDVRSADGKTLLGQDASGTPVQSVEVDAAAIAGGQVLVEVASLDERAHAEYWLHVEYE
jgi:hypothetical protein